jgi:hypothetical protein
VRRFLLTAVALTIALSATAAAYVLCAFGRSRVGEAALLRPSIFGLCIALTGCASSKVSSYVEAGSLTEPFTHLIVIASNLPLEERLAAEQGMAKTMKANGVRATIGTKVMPPTRLNDDAFTEAAIKNSGAQGALVLFEKGKGATSTYVPPTVIGPGYATTTGTIHGYGDLYSYSGTTIYTPPPMMPGYTVRKPIAEYWAAIYDFRLGRQIWIAEIESSGNAFANYADLADSAAKTAVKRLKRDGLI